MSSQAREIANRFAVNASIARVKEGLRLWKRTHYNLSRRPNEAYMRNQAANVVRHLENHLRLLKKVRHIGRVWHAESLMRKATTRNLFRWLFFNQQFSEIIVWFQVWVGVSRAVHMNRRDYFYILLTQLAKNFRRVMSRETHGAGRSRDIYIIK